MDAVKWFLFPVRSMLQNKHEIRYLVRAGSILAIKKAAPKGSFKINNNNNFSVSMPWYNHNRYYQ